MDTELKKGSFSSSLKKGLAFMAAVLCFAVAASVFFSLFRTNNGLDPLLEPDYMKSGRLASKQYSIYTDLNTLLKLKNEEYIKQGNTIDEQDLKSRIKYFVQTEDEARSSLIEEHLRNYYILLQSLENAEGMDYYATNGEDVYTNTSRSDRDYFFGHKAYYLFDKDGLKFSPSFRENYGYPTLVPTSPGVTHTIYVAVTDQYLDKVQTEWAVQASDLQKGIVIIVCALFLLVTALVYLIWKAGRKDDDGNLHLMTIDRLYTDFTVLLILGVVFAWAAITIQLFIPNYFTFNIQNISPLYWGVILLNSVFCSLGLALLLSLVRHIKNKTLLKHSLLYTVIMKLLHMVKSVLNSGPLAVKLTFGVILFEVIIFILTVSIVRTHYDFVFVLFWLFFCCLITAAAVYYILRKTRPLSDIAEGVQEIRRGRLDYIIDIPGDGTLARLARDINDIADGLKNAVEKEMKAERLKSELITNVSHDLKTPLTSIINYADLLSKENLTPQEANDYVAIIRQKSEKLNLLTQDLFDISKAQTGNIAMAPEKIDISELLRQSLAEFDEQIASSSLDFKVNIREEDMHILADGKLLSRVFENLTGNILKYALANTRVYIDAYTKGNSVFIEYKNIANYEMNFREDEIMERFIRGDKSRTTDGNGLGLAIAQSYVKACGGSLQINVDGDLFKATVKFSRA